MNVGSLLRVQALFVTGESTLGRTISVMCAGSLQLQVSPLSHPGYPQQSKTLPLWVRCKTVKTQAWSLHQRIHTGKPSVHQCGESFQSECRPYSAPENPQWWDPMNVMSGKAFSHSSHLIGHQRIHTGRSPMEVMSVKTFRGAHILLAIREATLGRKPINAMSVGGPSVKARPYWTSENPHWRKDPINVKECESQWEHWPHSASENSI